MENKEKKTWNLTRGILVFGSIPTGIRSFLIVIGDCGGVATANVIGLLQAATLSSYGFFSIIKLTFFLAWVTVERRRN